MENEKRLIDANALLRFAKYDARLVVPYKHTADDILAMVKTAPTVDAVEVVRCKDCKHYEDHKRKVYENCTRKDRFIPMKPDDYCSYGERRNNG